MPFVKAKSGFRRQRAQVTIDFFHLADPKREELYRDRFGLIRNLWGSIKADAQTTLEVLRSARSAHSSCASAFVKLFEQDPTKAFQVAQEAAKYLNAPRSERITWL